MRIRVGRSLRLVIALAFLVLMIPFLMFKLESINNERVSDDVKINDEEVKVKKDIHLFINHFFIYFYLDY